MDGQPHRNTRDTIWEEVKSNFPSLPVPAKQRSRTDDLWHTLSGQRRSCPAWSCHFSAEMQGHWSNQEPAVASPGYSFCFHSRLAESTTILKVGKPTIFYLPIQLFTPMCGCQQHKQNPCSPASVCALKFSSSHLCNQLWDIGKERFSMPQTNLFPALLVFSQQRLLTGSGFLHLEHSL